MEFVNSLLPTIEHFRVLGYWIAFLIALLETLAFVGLAVPGTALIILTGFLSARGFLDVGDLIWFVAAGAIVGDAISFYLGKRGEKFFNKNSRIFKSSYLEKGEALFKRHGGKSIVIGRFIGPLRPIIPFIAGLSKMGAKKFFSWNILGGFAWSILFVLLGFFFGQAWRAIEIWAARIGVFLFALFALFVLVYLFTWLVIKKGKQFFELAHSVIISIKEPITTNQDVKDFVARHASLFRFVGQRLDKNTFFGLPLTLLSIGFVYILFLFFGIIEDVLTSDPIVAADTRVANLLAVFRHAGFNQKFFWITLLGKWEIVLSSIAIVSILLWLWKKQIYIVPLWLSAACGELFNFLGKLTFHRAQPEAAFYIEDSFSFPSGHATIAVTFYGFLTYVLLRSVKSWKSKVNVVFVGIMLILAIGFSCLYLGIHFLSDVWSGYLLGLLWLIIGISISEWLVARKKRCKRWLVQLQKSKLFHFC